MSAARKKGAPPLAPTPAAADPAPGSPLPSPLSGGSLYDDLTLTLLQAEQLTKHLQEQLETLVEDFEEEGPASSRAYALSLVAEAINSKHARLKDQARAWLDADLKKAGA